MRNIITFQNMDFKIPGKIPCFWIRDEKISFWMDANLIAFAFHDDQRSGVNTTYKIVWN